MNKIKICGITNVDDANLCKDLPIDFVGFNFYPKSKRFINDTPINQENISFFEKLKVLKAGLGLRLQGKEEFQEFFRMRTAQLQGA